MEICEPFPVQRRKSHPIPKYPISRLVREKKLNKFFQLNWPALEQIVDTSRELGTKIGKM
jgi:hypothetical protein